MHSGSRTPVYGLDIVRLYAALAVVLYHFGFSAFAVHGNQILQLMHARPQLPSWWPVSWFGWVGVQVFFVISGLVISYSVEGSTARSFAEKRALRLVPVVWISALIALPVAILAFDQPLIKALAQLARTITFFPIGPWIMGQFWTLPIEVVFYGAIWVWILAGRRGSLEVLAWTLAGFACAYLVATELLRLADPAPRLSALLLLQHGQYFALGMLAFRIDSVGYRLRYLPLAVACVIMAAVQIRSVIRFDPQLAPLAINWAAPFGAWLLAMACVWASFHWKEAIARTVASHAKLIRHLGLITFPIYTLHIHTGGPMLALLIRAGLPPYLAILSSVLTVVLAASLVVEVFEPRIRKAMERGFAAARRTAVPVIA
jgi:peptidoglycan/LPS O-acetylase OafA/YrhL